MVEDAAGDDPVVNVKYPERSLLLALAISVGLVPAPVPAAQLGADAYVPLAYPPKCCALAVPVTWICGSSTDEAAVISTTIGKPQPP